jgi:hypothetical protein
MGTRTTKCWMGTLTTRAEADSDGRVRCRNLGPAHRPRRGDEVWLALARWRTSDFMSHVSCRMSHVSCRMPHGLCLVRHVSCLVSHVSSRVSCLVSRVSRLASRVMSPTFPPSGAGGAHVRSERGGGISCPLSSVPLQSCASALVSVSSLPPSPHLGFSHSRCWLYASGLARR